MPRGRTVAFAAIGLLVLTVAVVAARAMRERPAPPPSQSPAASAPAPEPISSEVVRRLEAPLRVWLDSWRAVAPGFALSQFERVHEAPIEESWEAFDADRLDPRRRPLYVYSPDGARFIDLYGAMELVEEGGKPTAIFDHGSSVTLYDAARGREMPLAACGSACLYEDAVWLFDDLIALVGGERSCGPDGSCTWDPMILLIDLSRKIETLYFGPEAASARRAPYFMIRLKQRLPDIVFK